MHVVCNFHYHIKTHGCCESRTRDRKIESILMNLMDWICSNGFASPNQMDNFWFGTVGWSLTSLFSTNMTIEMKDLVQLAVTDICKYHKKLIRRWDSEPEVLYDNILNHFYAVRPRIYWIQWNNAKQGPLRRSRSFNVTNFGTNRKLMYDFLLVINTNLPPVLHRFRDIAFDRSKIAIFGYPSCV